MLSHGSLVSLAIVPFLIAISAGGFATYLLFTNLSAWVTAFVTWILGGSTGIWMQLVYYPLLVGTGLVFFIGSVFVGYVAHLILAIPFYALIAERALSLLGMKPETPFDFKAWLRNSLRMFRVSVVKGVLFLVFGVILFVLSFVPLVNILAVLGTLMIMSFDLMDYSLESLSYGFRQRFRFILARRKMWLGMACGLGLTLFVPGLTFVVAPGAVVGGALLLREAHGSSTAT